MTNSREDRHVDAYSSLAKVDRVYEVSSATAACRIHPCTLSVTTFDRLLGAGDHRS